MVVEQAHPFGPAYSIPNYFYPVAYKLSTCFDHHSIRYTEAENLGGQGPNPPLFDKWGLSPPKLEVVMKNVLNTNSLCRILVVGLLGTENIVGALENLEIWE